MLCQLSLPQGLLGSPGWLLFHGLVEPAQAVTHVRQPEAAVRAFATPLKGPGKQAEMNAKVYRALRNAEFMSTDAASSELLGVKMLQRGLKLDGNDALCPHFTDAHT